MEVGEMGGMWVYKCVGVCGVGVCVIHVCI